MFELLRGYYERELAYIRHIGAEFADANPKIAARLRISADTVEDPHVARLIEAVAFLNARTRAKLEDEFPELTDAVLGVLYPHYLAPIPSMAIVQFACQPDLANAYQLPAGTEIDTEPVGGEPCRYRTCYPTTLWPIELEAAVLTGRPLLAPPNDHAKGAAGSLRLTLRCRVPTMTFTQLGVDRVRFFIKAPPQLAYPIYELILNSTVSIALANNAVDQSPTILPADSIKPVGFAPDEGVLPYPRHSFLGYRLLTEYFTFPEKFLFFDLENLDARTMVQAGNKLEIFLYVNRTSPDLERAINADAFALGCAPIVNLQKLRAEPIQLNSVVEEYRIVPDSRRPTALEVFSVDQVQASSPEGVTVTYNPFYSVKHVPAARRGGSEKEAGVRGPTTFWHAARRQITPGDAGTEMFLSLVDLNFDPTIPADWVGSVDVTCVNRELPKHIPFGGGRPQLHFAEAVSAVTGISCLTPPTPTIRPTERRAGRWKLISHLTLNHLSLTDGEKGTEALREILRLYDFLDTAHTRAIIDSVTRVSTVRGAARAPEATMGAFCRGIDVTIEFDPERMSGSGVFMLASVLERFLALYCSINSYTRLTAIVKGRSGVLRRWPPRAGDRVTL